MGEHILEKTAVRLIKVVRFLDGYALRPVEYGVRVQADAGIDIVYRQEGYVLFVYQSGSVRRGAHGGFCGQLCQEKRKDASAGVMEGTYGEFCGQGFQIHVESAVYQPLDVRLFGDHGEEVEDVCLYPSSAYPVKAGCTILQGHTLPGAELYFHIPEEEGGCRLMHDYPALSRDISIFMRGRTNDRRRSWYVWDKEKRTGEYFSLQKYLPDTQKYRLAAPMDSNYPKKDAAVCPAYASTADGNGQFYLLIGKLELQEYLLRYSVFTKTGADGKRRELCGETAIIGTKMNHLDIGQS